MSTSASAIYGFAVPRSLLYVTKVSDECDCAGDKGLGRYCQLCGKPRQVQKEEFILQGLCDRDIDGVYIHFREEAEYERRHRANLDFPIVIGFCVGDYNGRSIPMSNMNDLNEAQRRIRCALDQIGCSHIYKNGPKFAIYAKLS